MNLSIKNLAKKSSETFFVRSIGILFNFLYLYIISINYHAEGMGLFAFYQSALLILSILPQFGMNTSIIKFISENKKKYNILKVIIFRSLLIASFGSILFIFSIYYLRDFQVFIKNGVNLSIYLIFSILPFVIINIIPEIFRSLGSIKKFIIYKYSLLPVIGFLLLVITNYTITPIYSYILAIYFVFFVVVINLLYIN